MGLNGEAQDPFALGRPAATLAAPPPWVADSLTSTLSEPLLLLPPPPSLFPSQSQGTAEQGVAEASVHPLLPEAQISVGLLDEPTL